MIPQIIMSANLFTGLLSVIAMFNPIQLLKKGMQK